MGLIPLVKAKSFAHNGLLEMSVGTTELHYSTTYSSPSCIGQLLQLLLSGITICI